MDAVSKHEGPRPHPSRRAHARSSSRNPSGARAPQDEDGRACGSPLNRQPRPRRPLTAHTFELQFPLLITGRKQWSGSGHTWRLVLHTTQQCVAALQSLAAPDPPCITPLALALHRIRDTQASDAFGALFTFQTAQPLSFPRRVLRARGLQLCFTDPESRGGRSAEGRILYRCRAGEGASEPHVSDAARVMRTVA